MSQMNSRALYDSLGIGIRLQASYGNVAKAEVHIFAYLSCLLSLYKGWPVSKWGYTFISTDQGIPFALDIENSILVLLERGLMSQQETYYRVTHLGKAEYEILSQLKDLGERSAFLEGACSSILSLPVGIIRDAITQEPELQRANTLSVSRQLLHGPGLTSLHRQFERLSSAVGIEVSDLMIPAVIWLTYLAKVSDVESAN